MSLRSRRIHVCIDLEATQMLSCILIMKRAPHFVLLHLLPNCQTASERSSFCLCPHSDAFFCSSSQKACEDLIEAVFLRAHTEIVSRFHVVAPTQSRAFMFPTHQNQRQNVGRSGICLVLLRLSSFLLPTRLCRVAVSISDSEQIIQVETKLLLPLLSSQEMVCASVFK